MNYQLEFEKDDIIYHVNCDAYPGRPGRISGPPEYCYPPEPPELEINDVQITLPEGCTTVELPFPFDEALEDECWKQISVEWDGDN